MKQPRNTEADKVMQGTLSPPTPPATPLNASVLDAFRQLDDAHTKPADKTHHITLSHQTSLDLFHLYTQDPDSPVGQKAYWALTMSIYPWCFKIIRKWLRREEKNRNLWTDLTLDAACHTVQSWDPNRGRLTTIAYRCTVTIVTRYLSERERARRKLAKYFEHQYLHHPSNHNRERVHANSPYNLFLKQTQGFSSVPSLTDNEYPTFAHILDLPQSYELQDTHEYHRRLCIQCLTILARHLSTRNFLVTVKRLLHRETLDSIGKEHDISKERIRQIENASRRLLFELLQHDIEHIAEHLDINYPKTPKRVKQ